MLYSDDDEFFEDFYSFDESEMEFDYERYEPYYLYLASYNNIDIDERNPEIPLDDSSRCRLLIAATVQNKVDHIKKLLDSPDWYSVKNEEDCNNLLQIAIIHRNKEVCDFLLSLEGFPLEHKNINSKTAIGLALTLRGDSAFFDDIACALIQKGVSLDSVQLKEGETLLSIAAEMSKAKLTKLLLELGEDPNVLNSSGYPLIWNCLDFDVADQVETEIVTTLLCYGADPTIESSCGYNTFEYALMFCSYPIQEALFYHTLDDYTCIDIHFEVLLVLAKDNSPFFYETIKHTDCVVLGNSSLNHYHLIFTIGSEYLKDLIQKCPEVIQQVFAAISVQCSRIGSCCEEMSLANLDVLLHSELRDDTINFITNFSENFIIYCLFGNSNDESQMIPYIFYLLSYGLRLRESVLRNFYGRYVNGPLVKTLLHMDIERLIGERCVFDAFFLFIFDVTLTMDEYLRDPEKYSSVRPDSLLQYFCHPKLKSLCYDERVPSLCEAIDKLPQVPRLTELARNTFRQYFLKFFKIKNAKEFYSLLKGLDVSNTYKKIITYETKLYELTWRVLPRRIVCDL